MSGNLPAWSGASDVYSRAYRALELMGAAEWRAEINRCRKTGRKPRGIVPSEDMTDLIDALSKGEEERIKGLMLRFV